MTVVDRGSSSGGTSAACEGNLLVSDKGPGPELDLARHAAARWPEVAAQLAAQLGPAFPSIEYERKGGIVVATTEPGAAALLSFAETQRPAGVDAQAMSTAEAHDLEPDLNPAVTAAVHYPQDAQVQPTIATEALLASARLCGAAVRTGAEVTGCVLGADGRITGVRTPGRPVRGRGAGRCRPVVRRGVRPARRVRPDPPAPGHAARHRPDAARIFHKVYDGDYVGATQSGDAACRPRAWWSAPRAAPC